MSSEAAVPTAAGKANSASNEEGVINCPYCGDTVSSLMPIETGMRLGLQENAQLTSLPDSVCPGCHSILSKMISKGAALRAHANAKEQNKLMLWRNRVALVKKAKEFMAQKNFSESAVHFEKYLRVLELVYEKKSGELSPDLFSAESRKSEMTVVASVYWDLMRIYDQTPRYKDRQMKAATKLAEFIRFTPINAHIVRKAESQGRTAKNPEAFKHFLKLSNSNRRGCFVATAAFENQSDPTVEILRLYRDRVLRRSEIGRRFTLIYYRFSPPLARAIEHAPPALRAALRFVLRNFAKPLAEWRLAHRRS